MKRRSARQAEAGYALLFVYAMAAVVAIMLYSELPRVAFQAQREKEQLLIDRGEQYTRAITLYVRKNNRFPPDFDALDKTPGQRYLRHRYKDPLTGKDEWRVIHVGPGGAFTDSLIYNKKSEEKKEQQTFITELQQVGGTVTDPNAQGANLAARRRPSDVPGAAGGGQNGEPGVSNAIPNGVPNGVPNPFQNSIPNGIPNGVGSGNSNGVPAFQTLANGQIVPVPPGGNYQPEQQVQLPPGVQFPPGVQPPPGFGGAPIQPSASASNLLSQILTTPRPGGLQGNGQAPAVDQFGRPLPQGGAAAQGQVIGGGIAGVASKVEREGIKIYRARTAYNEWEFVYDLSQDKTRQGAGGVPGAATGTAPGQTPAQPASATPVAPVYTPPPPPPSPPPPQYPTGVPNGIIDPGYNPAAPTAPTYPAQPGTPGGPFTPTAPGFPGQPIETPPH